MVNEDDYSAKLIDFGLSLVVTDKTDKREFKRSGTVGYMAPEVMESTALNRKRYNDRCDIFGMGIILHLMLTGFHPLKGKTYNETLKNNTYYRLKINEDQILSLYG